MATCDLKLPAGLVAHDFDTAQQLADALAETVAERLKQAISKNGLATLVVSGGRSPVA
ncbi:6-phosphogluconolactonase, partial [Pseudomonas syringae pv. syringae FF5]